VVIPTAVIEGCQLFTPRATSVDDLILNASGVVLGYLLFWFLRLCGFGKNTTLKREKM
jgi:glycopeptide antibiotics resistance protein